VDSYENPDALAWLEGCGQLHSPSNSWGFIPGEGAAFCLLVSNTIAQREALAPLASILRVATAREENRIKTRTVCTGAGLTAAYREALAALPAETLIDDLICDLNGEPYRADEFGFTLVRTGPQFRHPGVFRAPADCWGDVGAASGCLFAVLPAVAVQRGYAKGNYTLLSSSSESGERCAAVVLSHIRHGSRQ
jgi:3-oxoacyl-[acyl-carrier-protein] synthase I